MGDSEDDDLIPLQSGEDWIAQLDDDLSVDTNGVLWRKRSSEVSQLQLLEPKPGRE